MGKIPSLTKEQTLILDLAADDSFIQKHFYFTGGTALSALYLQHRESVDLDFFNFHKFDNQIIFASLSEWSKKNRFTVDGEPHGPVYVCLLNFSSGSQLKVDFAYYPYRQVATPNIFHGMTTDSLEDIGANKLLTITQRHEVKDYVDLFFLLKKFTPLPPMPHA